MRSTLFLIPHEIAGIPLFGFGLLLACLAIGWMGWTAWSLARKHPLSELVAALPVWFIAAAIVAFVLPSVELRLPDGTPLGLPIRGYGVMVLLGLFAGIGITIYRGNQLHIAPDIVVGLGFWMMLGGIAGARIFYIVQKWQDFAPLAMSQRVVAIFKLTEGGLVIYGGVIGGLLAAAFYCRRHHLKPAATADLIAPSFLIGLAIGRVGCLLHGCCFGGVCTADLPAIHFPQGSVPYQSQLASGQLLGIELQDTHAPPGTVSKVVTGSPADLAHIHTGEVLEAIDLSGVQLPQADNNPVQPLALRADARVDGRRFTFLPSELPSQSLPVHPSQIYASINALLLCLLVWQLQPIAKRDGATFLVAILLYACSRFLLEGVRSDEGGQLGTYFTIAQIIAIASALLAGLGLVALSRFPARRAWDWPSLQNSAGNPVESGQKR